MSARARRHVRKERIKQLKFYLTNEDYEKLFTLADQQNQSPTALAKRLVLQYLGILKDQNIAVQVKEQNQRSEQLQSELARLEKDYAMLLQRDHRQEEMIEKLSKQIENLIEFETTLARKQTR